MLQPHQQRVVDEKSELDEKREKLSSFFETPMFSNLDIGEQARMRYQAVAMREYSAVLGERIEAFTASQRCRTIPKINIVRATEN